MFEGTEEFFKKYQDRAKAEGVDPLGYYLGGWGYAYIQVLGDAVQGRQQPEGRQARRLHHARPPSRPSTATSSSARVASGPRGRMLQVQYHGIKQGDGLDVYRGMSYQTVLTPADLRPAT